MREHILIVICECLNKDIEINKTKNEIRNQEKAPQQI